jgi:uncharacterized protein
MCEWSQISPVSLTMGRNLRTVGIIGRGTIQNLRDLPYLRGVDIALMHSDALDIAKKLGEIPNVDKIIHYIARLQNEEMHVLATNDIVNISQLAGKRVSVSAAGSGVAASSANVFDRLHVPVQFVNFPEHLALEKLKAGELDAVVVWDPYPAEAITGFVNDGRFHLVPVPYDENLRSVYFQVSVPADTYPDLVPPGQKLETVSLNAVIAVYNWPAGTERYKRVSRFTNLFFAKFSELQQPGRDAIWTTINPAAVVPGWQRFPPAQNWLSQDGSHTASAASGARTRIDINPPDKELLFQQFLNWRSGKTP